MNYQAWLERFQNLISALQQAGHIGVHYFIRKPTDEEDLQDTEDYIARRANLEHFKIPAKLREFFRVSGGFDFQWVHNKPPRPFESLTGTCMLSTLSEMFDPAADEPRYIPEDLGAGFSPYDRLRTFDDAGTTAHVLAMFSEASDDAALFWRTVEENEGERLTPLTIGFDEYLENGLAACFLHGWQRLFVEDSTLVDEQQVEEFFAQLKAVAPHGNIDALRRARSEAKRRQK